MSQNPGQIEEEDERRRRGAAIWGGSGGAAATTGHAATRANLVGTATGIALALASIFALVSCQSNVAADQTYENVIDYNAVSGQ